MPTPELLETLEMETAPSPTAAVIWLRGLGADRSARLVDMVPAGTRRAWHPSPRAMHGDSMAAPSSSLVQHVRSNTGVRREDEAGVRESQRHGPRR